LRPGAAPPDQGRRADCAHHRRVLDAEGARPPSAPAAVARQARAARARPRVRAVRPQPRRPDLAPEEDDRARPDAAALHPDRLGRRLRLRSGRSVLTIEWARPAAPRVSTVDRSPRRSPRRTLST